MPDKRLCQLWSSRIRIQMIKGCSVIRQQEQRKSHAGVDLPLEPDKGPGHCLYWIELEWTVQKNVSLSSSFSVLSWQINLPSALKHPHQVSAKFLKTWQEFFFLGDAVYLYSSPLIVSSWLWISKSKLLSPISKVLENRFPKYVLVRVVVIKENQCIYSKYIL